MTIGKYRLYAVRLEDIKSNDEYFLVTPDYCLLYTNKTPPKRSERIQNESILPDLAKRWLMETVDEIRKADMNDVNKKLLRQSAEFQRRFATELEVERQKLRKEAGNENVTDAHDESNAD